MNDALRHRGPNDEGYAFIHTPSGRTCAAHGRDTAVPEPHMPLASVDPAAFDLVLGNRRLAILDLSPAGHMPMSRDEGRLWITYNGEVYNHRELKNTLLALGHRFVSGTDTEVILASYAEWGSECVSRFNGMFSFALWDDRRKRLFCVRDHFGIKPFYYHLNGTSFLFSSEIKSLLEHPLVPRVPDEEAIFDYLALGLSDHGAQTFFSGIRALPPAHVLVLDVASCTVAIRRYWNLEVNRRTGFEGLDPQRTCSRFGELLEDAIRLRLRSDVPIGTCLSGGLDSSAIVCLANRLLLQEQIIPRELVGEHQKTFTARNDEEEIDEHRFSHLVVRETGAEENLVLPDGRRLWDEIEAFAWSMDEPVDSTSQYPQWTVMRLARERGVTVLLDGQGGDEVLAGYYSYLPSYIRQVFEEEGRWSAVCEGWHVSRVGGATARRTLARFAVDQMPWRARQAVESVFPRRPAPGQGGSGLRDTQLAPEFLARHVARVREMEARRDSDLAGTLHRDLTSTNLPKLLRYEDRNSMAFSIETRLPFLDPRLVELAFGLPLGFRIHGGWTKWILRTALSDVLPPQICWRRSKLGFPIPEKRWLRAGNARIRDLLADSSSARLQPYIQQRELSRIVAATDVELASTPGLWRMTNLAIWLRLFFDSP